MTFQFSDNETVGLQCLQHGPILLARSRGHLFALILVKVVNFTAIWLM